eukprot:scaffold129997_cov60-Phaeocystis_antarctica.AAC.3
MEPLSPSGCISCTYAQVGEDRGARQHGERAAAGREGDGAELELLVRLVQLGRSVLPRGARHRPAHLELVGRAQRQHLALRPPRTARDALLELAREVLPAAHEGLVGAQVPHGEVAVGQSQHELAHLAPAGEVGVEVLVALQHGVAHHAR